ncbi:ISMca6, transposase, OrfA [Stappia aggregata IAM 12614]|uniref:ISMca6, transposase, OrfA n=1 Tax=Roseibium aggregatum (strain ATCC 25650 / DSM 13394 / JCM 20685 / NBRC 16684 / NCIMB 2208 / IAM 12614 / B1) TaxID=384765 RepID=A0P0P8_ROSAI|nr:hypothetical protein [Roseibium aggregatum]EAV40706.1 ISMca6, transposase, OrfA [Stappia aggregata IAM 12614] [Roseibium aggregatum IAM 12614]EAV41362.1 ISMca6, transposase, OrfA [Stappia aggregata IAM 12614] [Roseibium aggregatum IAM 12614]
MPLLNAALRRAPVYTSVRGILRQIDPDALGTAFRRHAEGLDRTCAPAGPSRFIAIDGKTLRQSFDAFSDTKAAYVLSAFAVDHQIILTHEVVDEKSNEILAAQALIVATALWKSREETSIYASSVMLDAMTFAPAIRNH